MRYAYLLLICIFLLVIEGCSNSATTLPIPPHFESTKLEDNMAVNLNPCQKGVYYDLLQQRKQMIYYIQTAEHVETAKEAADNLVEIDFYIEQLLVSKKIAKLCK